VEPGLVEADVDPLIRIGTSGWSYPSWVGPFYPTGTPASRLLGAYAASFWAVEAHSTFRRLPTAAAVERWAAAVPPGFRFAPKAHAGITHRRDPEGLAERVEAFYRALAPLGDRLGPVLYVLPHRRPDLARLDALLGALGGRSGAVFELGPAWRVEPVLDRLAAAGASLALVDRDDDPALDRTFSGPLAYARLRREGYGDGDLAGWATRLVAETEGGRRPVFAFLKHDEEGYGPRYARALVGHVDEVMVTALLGRAPQGAFEVAVRRPDGRPLVIRNQPLLDDGTPMPTRYWLVDEDLRRAVSGLEAAGGVRAAEAAVDPEALRQAHARYAAERDAALPAGHTGPRPSGGVGGTRVGVKCLHAHLAWHLAGGDDPVGRWVEGQLR
jgi:uncharacterized protein